MSSSSPYRPARTAASARHLQLMLARQQRPIKRKWRLAGRLTEHEVDCLVHVYNELAASQWNDGTPSVSIACLHTAMKLAFDVAEPDAWIDRVCGALMSGDLSLHVCTLDEWMTAMTLFLRGTLDEQMRHCYRCYDPYATNALEVEHIQRLLRGRAIAQREDADEVEYELQTFADMMMLKLDVDRDAAVSWEDYSGVVRKQPMLLECLGPCIPSRLSLHAFLMTFAEQPDKF